MSPELMGPGGVPSEDTLCCAPDFCPHSSFTRQSHPKGALADRTHPVPFCTPSLFTALLHWTPGPSSLLLFLIPLWLPP